MNCYRSRKTQQTPQQKRKEMIQKGSPQKRKCKRVISIQIIANEKINAGKEYEEALFAHLIGKSLSILFRVDEYVDKLVLRHQR